MPEAGRTCSWLDSRGREARRIAYMHAERPIIFSISSNSRCSSSALVAGADAGAGKQQEGAVGGVTR